MAMANRQTFPDVTKNTDDLFTFDWRSKIKGSDFIAATTADNLWEILPTGPTLGTPTRTNNNQVSNCRISGFTAGTDYVVKNIVTDNNGYTYEARALVHCMQEDET